MLAARSSGAGRLRLRPDRHLQPSRRVAWQPDNCSCDRSGICAEGAACRAGCLLGHASPWSTRASEDSHQKNTHHEVIIFAGRTCFLPKLFTFSSSLLVRMWRLETRLEAQGPGCLRNQLDESDLVGHNTYTYEACAGVHVQTSISPFGHTHTRARVCMHMYMYIYIYAHTYIHGCICIYIYICMYVVYIYIYVCVCM